MAESQTQGQRIRQRRLEKRLTQEYLATQLNTTKQAIYKYEADIVQNIPLEKMLRLAQLLDCSPAWLQGFTADPADAAPANAPAGESYRLYAEYLDVLQRLTPEDRRAVLDYSRYLLSRRKG